MPFKSEKQRRFLWAEHPDIAKRWAHEYPNKKKLPMYANKTDKKPENKTKQPDTAKSAAINIPDVIARYVNNGKPLFIRPANTDISKTDKTADSKQEVVDIPHSSKPVYAGEEREKGEISSAIPTGKNIGGSCAEKPKNAINELLTKLSVVLSPQIEQTIENMKAEREGRVARRMPRNRGVKRYPCGGINIMPPMQITQNQPQNQQSQQNNQYPARPVGGGSHPQFNPINSFGALSTSGVINGNAAFGAKNSPDSSKLSCFIPAAINRNKQATRSEVLEKLMAISTVTPEDVRYYDEEFEEEMASKSASETEKKPEPDSKKKQNKPDKPAGMSALQTGLLGAAGGLGGFAIGEYLDSKGYSLGRLISKQINKTSAAKDIKTDSKTPCSCGCGDTISTCKCSSSCSCRKPGGSCYKHKNNKNNKEKAADMVKYSLEDTLKHARCWAGYEPVPGKKPYSNNSCRPVSSGKKKNKKEEKKASTPAWQRSEGKNEAGGLNEKGRKSYEREHGGNLQAPVTESNPKGKAKKRQDSFCSRMCGMKRVNTGASTAKDPDSRINKSLRKWNCKCSSAELFGQNLAGLTEKEAWLGAVLGAGGRLAAKALPAAAKAVAPAAQAARTAAPAAAQAARATAAPVVSTSRALATGAAQAAKAAPKVTITPQQAARAVPLPKSPGLVTPAPRTMQPPPLPVKPGMSGPALERTTGRILDATGRPVPMKAPPPVPAAPTAPKVTISPAEAAAGRSAMKITPQDMASSMWEGATGQGRRQMMGAAANADIPGIHNMPFSKLSPEMQRTVMQAMGYAQ